MSVPRAKHKLCMPSKVPGVAGPANFQHRLSEGLEQSGWAVFYGFESFDCDVILVIGGSRQFSKLRKAKKMGIPIVQRLDGMNWTHRRVRTGVRHFLRAELNNYILRLIRTRYADWLIYQSEFAQGWWEGKYGSVKAEKSVILNGVPLDQYFPGNEEDRISNLLRLLMVEGNIRGGYEIGLHSGIHLADELVRRTDQELEFVVVGNVPEALKKKFVYDRPYAIRWIGLLPTNELPSYYRSAHFLFSGDPNPACPNAVIEAIACGLPVLAFATGAIPEIIKGNAGRIVPYGGDVWKLVPPDIESLADAAVEVLGQLASFRVEARTRAVEAFDVRDMVMRYISVFNRVREKGSTG